MGLGAQTAPFGGLDLRVSTKCEGCSEAKPLGMPGGSAKRGRRAEGPEEPAGGLPPKRRRGLAWFIHRQRSPQDVKDFKS